MVKQGTRKINTKVFFKTTLKFGSPHILKKKRRGEEEIIYILFMYTHTQIHTHIQEVSVERIFGIM